MAAGSHKHRDVLLRAIDITPEGSLSTLCTEPGGQPLTTRPWATLSFARLVLAYSPQSRPGNPTRSILVGDWLSLRYTFELVNRRETLASVIGKACEP